MDLNRKHIARLMLRNRILKASGDEFERIFTEIMSASRPDFRQVKPQGALGDRKNDGFEPKAGRYFQVYAPEDLRRRKQNALNKLEEDFQGLYTHWTDLFPSGIQEFYFVLNDCFSGAVFPSIHETLERIRRQYGLDRCEPFLTKHLEEEFFSLSDDRIVSIIDFIPNPESIPLLDYSVLGEVIRHVLENPVDLVQAGSLRAPDFDEKIRFNGLRVAGHLLNTASYQSGAVEEYFAANSDFERQSVRDTLNGYYLDAMRVELPDFDDSDGGAATDQRFLEILTRITPQIEDRRKQKELQEAALAIMAVFFESCDIFENPER
ncbi:MAG: hypothetical protein LGR52_11705 [Candidatus Thiosymbion ectosymbiont of Robbea hypermnestra]|nr:hypothetical protein [Candidatus Thiosymbion ectosymbiont of Robbea hypermnestra]